MSPFISIIIPTHKRAKLLSRALKSIKLQAKLSLIEIIVISDSLDAPTDLVCTELLSANDIYIRRNNYPGPAASRNLGLKLAQGSYILFLDDDDALHPNFMEQLLLRRGLLIGMPAYFNCSIIKETRPPEGPRTISASDLNLGEALSSEVFVRNQIPLPCFVFPKVLLTGLNFDDHMRAYEDWDFVLSIIERVMPLHFPFLGCQIFQVDDATTDRRSNSKAANDFNAVLDYLYVYRRHPAPTEALRIMRADLLAKVSLQIPQEVL